MSTLVLYALLSASLYYLGSRAMITARVWSSYPPAVARFMDCAACTGFWYGLGLALTVGRLRELDFVGLDSQDWLTPIVVAYVSIITTPIMAALQQRALEALGIAVPEEAIERPVSPSE